MVLFIILYMLMSYKAGWGVEWYDWGLFFFVFFATFFKSFTEHLVETHATESATKESYFDDLKKGSKTPK